MRSFLRILILVLLAALLLPVMAYAAGPFYTSTTGSPTGTGSGSDPRRATTPAELTAACQYFGAQLGAGEIATFYWILIADGNQSFFEYNLDSSGTCTPVGALRPGTPPGFGVTLTPPLIVGGLLVLGGGLLGVAWLLRRRLRNSARPT